MVNFIKLDNCTIVQANQIIKVKSRKADLNYQDFKKLFSRGIEYITTEILKVHLIDGEVVAITVDIYDLDKQAGETAEAWYEKYSNIINQCLEKLEILLNIGGDFSELG